MKTIVFDMYGVIIKESKGNFIPYTFGSFPQDRHEYITRMFRDEKLFNKAGNGEINSHEFLSRLGFADPEFHMCDYIENHLTMDEEFYAFADAHMDRYNYALLSNDVSDWSKYITEHYLLDRYLPVKIVSADVHCKKPSAEIFEIALGILGVPAGECIFIDNSTANLRMAAEFGMETVLFNRDGEEYDGNVVYTFPELSILLADLQK